MKGQCLCGTVKFYIEEEIRNLNATVRCAAKQPEQRLMLRLLCRPMPFVGCRVKMTSEFLKGTAVSETIFVQCAEVPFLTA